MEEYVTLICYLIDILTVWLLLLTFIVMYVLYKLDIRVAALERRQAEEEEPDEAQIEEGPTAIGPPPRLHQEPSEWDGEPIEVRIRRSTERHRQERGIKKVPYVELPDDEIDRDATTIP